jgi:hypothetical protein
MELKLSVEEEELIKEILEEHHRELLMEIARADHREFKHDLRKKEQVLRSVLNKVCAVAPARKAG